MEWSETAQGHRLILMAWPGEEALGVSGKAAERGGDFTVAVVADKP